MPGEMPTDTANLITPRARARSFANPGWHGMPCSCSEQPRRTRHLAAPVLGIYDLRRARLCRPQDYTHFKPVAHGLVEHPADWPHSSFRRCAAGGLYPAAWVGGSDEPQE